MLFSFFLMSAVAELTRYRFGSGSFFVAVKAHKMGNEYLFIIIVSR